MACYEAETYILVYNTLYCIVYIVHWEVGWPLPLPWICLLLLIPGLHCHPIAGTHGQCRPGKCPPFSAYLKEAEFPMAQKKPVSFPWISFLLTVKQCQQCQVCTFHVAECHPGSFPTRTQLHLHFFPLLSACQIRPVHSVESAVSTFPVGFCRLVVKPFHTMDRNRNSY